MLQVILLLSTIILAHASSLYGNVDNPAERLMKVKKLVQRIKNENPSTSVSRAEPPRHKNKTLHDIRQDMRNRIMAVQNSVPSLQKEEALRHNNTSTAIQDNPTVREEKNNQLALAARLEKFKRGIAVIKRRDFGSKDEDVGDDVETDDWEESDDDNDDYYDEDDDDNNENKSALKVTLNKPLGIILDDLIHDKAIVYSLNEEHPGAAQELSISTQEELMGRRIVSINDEDVRDLTLMQLAERIVALPSPITLEFELVEEEEEEEEEDKGEEEPFAYKIDYYDKILPEQVSPGQLSLLKWNDNQDIVDPYAAQIGLPDTLVPTIQAYVKRLGILELMKHILYDHPCDPNDGHFYETDNPHLSNDFYHKDKLQWYAQRPGDHWKSDMHWLAGSDERTHESMLYMLFQGGFEQVLEAIGIHYELDGLIIQSIGFLGVAHCDEGYLHHDFSNVDGKFFNLLIPITSPDGADAELTVAGMKNHTSIVGASVKYDPSFGVLVGDKALHGTRECNHRSEGNIRMVMSIYLADIDEDNIQQVSTDDTAIFPIPGEDEWLWAQKGRHWRKDMCMLPDRGRQPFAASDASDLCTEVAKYGKCKSNPKEARKYCPQSCNVYMNDLEYRPGVERSIVAAGFDFGI